MSRKLQAVIFDIAGTIADTGSLAPVYAFQRAFSKCGITISIDAIRKDMGKAKYEHIKEIIHANENQLQHKLHDMFGNVSQDKMTKHVYELFEQSIVDCIRERASWIDGVPRVLHGLQNAGVRLGACTGYSTFMTTPIKELIAAERLKMPIVANSDVSVGRPHPYMMWRLCEILNVPRITPLNVVKVGDTFVDIKEGINANAFSVGVTLTGNMTGLSDDELQKLTPAQKAALHYTISDAFYKHGADATIKSVAELPQLLQERGFISHVGHSPWWAHQTRSYAKCLIGL